MGTDIILKFLAFVAAAILWRIFRGPLLSLARSALKKGPDALESIVSRKADQLYPSWRLKAGISRRRTTLEWRIQKVRESWRPAYFILGGVYLDLMLRPIKVKSLENTEHSDLDQVRYEYGGSACHVGAYLFENFQQKSYLYSRLGQQSALSTELKRRLRIQKWIKRAHYQNDPHAQSGVSIHLLQEDESYRTTFTHKGALDGFNWRPLLDKLIRKTGRGGFLHISGYFRTGLHNELCHSLEQLSPNLIVCVDHGRFLPEDHVNAANALTDAFKRNLIDVYVCTFPELRRLMMTAGVVAPDSLSITEVLHSFAKAGKLPRITVVRGEVSAQQVSAHLILDGILLPSVTVRPGMPVSRDQPGKNNAFNAALAYHLSNGNPQESITDAVTKSVELALESWIRTART